jgi:hypothetical protein
MQAAAGTQVYNVAGQRLSGDKAGQRGLSIVKSGSTVVKQINK